jgi:hypothetical protein
MGREQRLVALASLGLFVSMFLPWYSKTDAVVVGSGLQHSQASLSAFEAFSFVEAAVLLVSAGVIAVLFARAERRPFRLPGGDGLIVMVAGGWTALLIFYRLLDKPGLQGNQRITATVGVQWGIFIALLLALGLLYAGRQLRAVERPEPPLERNRARPPRSARSDDPSLRRGPPEEDLTALTPAPGPPKGSTPVAADPRLTGGRPRYPPAPSEQMSFEDPPARPE